jgi:hypothetical protein
MLQRRAQFIAEVGLTARGVTTEPETLPVMAEAHPFFILFSMLGILCTGRLGLAFGAYVP